MSRATSCVFHRGVVLTGRLGITPDEIDSNHVRRRFV
jgi:hypothetical protein